jgi:carbon-monoxide dehydrogenase small subunit
MEPDVLDGPDTTDRAGARVVSVIVNGERRGGLAPVRMTLADFVRHELGLTGTHLGCEHGVCGACTVLLKSPGEEESGPDGQAVRSCLVFAVQAEGGEVTTIEGIAAGASQSEAGQLSVVQTAFREHHALQCGFCTPGFVISVTAFLRDHPDPTDEQIRDALSGNLCRCTGYQGILAAVRAAADHLRTDNVRTDKAHTDKAHTDHLRTDNRQPTTKETR